MNAGAAVAAAVSGAANGMSETGVMSGIETGTGIVGVGMTGTRVEENQHLRTSQSRAQATRSTLRIQRLLRQMPCARSLGLLPSNRFNFFCLSPYTWIVMLYAQWHLEAHIFLYP